MSPMSPIKHPWEQIYQNEGRGDENPFPRFYEVVESFKGFGCSRILDLGCGSGRHFLHLAQEGFRVVGMDISPTALRLTQEWVDNEDYEPLLVLADMRMPLPFKSSSFDGVFSTQVIHHARMVRVRRTIQETFRVLGSGGAAFITVSGGRDEGIPYKEIEPGTIIPLSGSERGLPHRIFTESDLRVEFSNFQIEEVSSRAGGKVLAVLARKP